jgi:hypothetical protein
MFQVAGIEKARGFIDDPRAPRADDDSRVIDGE